MADPTNEATEAVIIKAQKFARMVRSVAAPLGFVLGVGLMVVLPGAPESNARLWLCMIGGIVVGLLIGSSIAKAMIAKRILVWSVDAAEKWQLPAGQSEVIATRVRDWLDPRL